MPASSLIQCVPAVDLVNWIQFIGEQGALLFPSAKSIKGFDRKYGDHFIDEILKEYPEELRGRRYIFKEKNQFVK